MADLAKKVKHENKNGTQTPKIGSKHTMKTIRNGDRKEEELQLLADGQTKEQRIAIKQVMDYGRNELISPICIKWHALQERNLRIAEDGKMKELKTDNNR